MVSYIAICAKALDVPTINKLRVHGVMIGTTISTSEGIPAVLVWNANTNETALRQLAILKTNGVPAEMAKDFIDIGNLIEKFMS